MLNGLIRPPTENLHNFPASDSARPIPPPPSISSRIEELYVPASVARHVTCVPQGSDRRRETRALTEGVDIQ